MKDRIIQLMVRFLMYVREVSNMREAQKEYFHFRNAENMVEAIPNGEHQMRTYL